MDSQAKVDILNRVLHGTVNSVVQYIGISSPHVPAGKEKDLETLKRMQGEEAEAAHEINALVSDLDGVPSVGVFEYWNVDLNYLDLDFLARFAAKHQQKVIAAMERDIDGVRDDARVHGLLRRILEQKREHLGVLQGLGGEEG
ncbi:MAG: hypothetical protein ACYTGV_14985 [Planctomycetota bacterium]|jgi:bacterioferritin (cytochrome b1)